MQRKESYQIKKEPMTIQMAKIGFGKAAAISADFTFTEWVDETAEVVETFLSD